MEAKRARYGEPEPTTTTIEVFAGSSACAGHADGTRAHALFNSPGGICEFTSNSGVCSFMVTDDHAVRIITNAGVVTTLCGGGEKGYHDGIGPAAKFTAPAGTVTARCLHP